MYNSTRVSKICNTKVKREKKMEIKEIHKNILRACIGIVENEQSSTTNIIEMLSAKQQQQEETIKKLRKKNKDFKKCISVLKDIM